MAQSVKPVDAGISVGQVFQGKYRVDAILGHGGMGVVAECTHLHLNERVAIKMLRQDVLMDQDAVSRFIREAQAAVKLKSEYVARVSDVGTFENGVPYMVMEFLEGHDLGELLKQRGVLPVQWAVELMLQTCEALAEAHSLNIVHRDVKPTNLFVTWRPDGSALVKVLDFGISKSPMGTDMQLTQTQSLLGTPAYMSPEQMRSARLVDTRTDIWSLGTVFYEVLEGRRPFEAESFSEMCVKVAVDPPAQMVNTPPGLQQVILRCLAKSPEQRFSSMAELGRELVPFAADQHQAHMLVERMARMLRRAGHGGGDWDMSTGTGVNRLNVPQSSRDLGSGPVRAQTPIPQWGRGSDPAAAPWQAKSDPAARAYAPAAHDQSQPFARPLPEDVSGVTAGPTLKTGATKRRWPLVLLLLVIATGGAVGAAMALSSDDKPAASVQPETPEAIDPKVENVVAPQAGSAALPVAAGSAATDTKLPTEAQPAIEPKADGSAAATDEKLDIKTETKTDTTETAAGSGSKKSGKSGKSGGKTGKTDAKAIKTGTGIKVDVKAGQGSGAPVAPVEPKVESKPCDPFGSMHGCTPKR